MRGACGNIVKYLLFIFNLVFVLCGLALIVVGSLLLADVGDFSEITDRLEEGVVTAPAVVLIVVGVFIFAIAFFGCCGAIKESKCLLITYSVLLILIFVVQLAIGIYAIVTFQGETVKSVLTDIFNKHEIDQSSNDMFSSLETSLKCCGVNGEADYGQNYWKVPSSCCVTTYCTDNIHYSQGCAEALQDFIVDAGKILGGVALGLAFLEILGVIFAFYEMKKMRNNYLN